MSTKYKHLEGAVSVNGDRTPITRRPIDQIDASQWEEMTFEQLVQQHGALLERIQRAQTMSRGDLAKQMQAGLKYLQQLIQEKEPKESARLV